MVCLALLVTFRSKEVTNDLQNAFHAFCRGAYVEFLTEVSRIWVNSAIGTGRRAALVAKWLPDVYFRCIGLANLPLSFDLYQLAMQVATQSSRPKTADVAIDVRLLADLLARYVAARTRILTPKSQTHMLYFPEHLANPSSSSSSSSGERFEMNSTWPLLWQTPSGGSVWPKKDDSSITDVDEECQTEEMQRGMYQTEWTKLLVGSSIIRRHGVPRGELFKFAVWLENLRSRGNMDATVFLHCMDTICSSNNNTTVFRDVVDPARRYTETIYLFMRTMRACLVQDIGQRVYVLFYWTLITRCIDSESKRSDHHHVSNLAHFTDLDAHNPPARNLVLAILEQLGMKPQQQTLLLPPPAQMTPLTSSNTLLPCAENALLSSPMMDWSHPFGRDWIHKMDMRFNAPSLHPKPSQRKTIDVDHEELQRHLQSVNDLASKEIDKYFGKDASTPLEEVDESAIKPLPQIHWGELNHFAKIDLNGRLWVGPFDISVAYHRQNSGELYLSLENFKNGG